MHQLRVRGEAWRSVPRQRGRPHVDQADVTAAVTPAEPCFLAPRPQAFRRCVIAAGLLTGLSLLTHGVLPRLQALGRNAERVAAFVPP